MKGTHLHVKNQCFIILARAKMRCCDILVMHIYVRISLKLSTKLSTKWTLVGKACNKNTGNTNEISIK